MLDGLAQAKLLKTWMRWLESELLK